MHLRSNASPSPATTAYAWHDYRSYWLSCLLMNSISAGYSVLYRPDYGRTTATAWPYAVKTDCFTLQRSDPRWSLSWSFGGELHSFATFYAWDLNSDWQITVWRHWALKIHYLYANWDEICAEEVKIIDSCLWIGHFADSQVPHEYYPPLCWSVMLMLIVKSDLSLQM